MNASARIEPAGQMVNFDAACARLNQWRGQMIENLARAEQAVTETLVRLNETAPPVKGVKFPYLVGQDTIGCNRCSRRAQRQPRMKGSPEPRSRTSEPMTRCAPCYVTA
ncbi:hypothetical protein SPHINGO361_120554 [Sphingomonas sp. EC-HK361]|uniref:hypothetical protein n=1 Tax=Sphingomonas sp. EC-HK361 TaxID=2038397 RepID=UPI001259C0EF|nr:hypothetical protein [Sphingomonas sp. EC-HK361]VVT10215.1 hypothetical protein SPHINGO361_120554 [Sphingomonas sp. EC-HK361]